MNCRKFECQAADWISKRLPAECAEEMVAHGETCAACARAALAEREFRESWRRSVEARLTPDLWPQLAPHLTAQARTPGLISHGPRWAFAAVLALAALGVYHGSRGQVKSSGAEKTAAASVQSHAASWSALGKLAQDDPAVDDPVGTSMEPLWICLKTDGK